MEQVLPLFSQGVCNRKRAREGPQHAPPRAGALQGFQLLEGSQDSPLVALKKEQDLVQKPRKAPLSSTIRACVSKTRVLWMDPQFLNILYSLIVYSYPIELLF